MIPDNRQIAIDWAIGARTRAGNNRDWNRSGKGAGNTGNHLPSPGGSAADVISGKLFGLGESGPPRAGLQGGLQPKEAYLDAHLFRCHTAGCAPGTAVPLGTIRTSGPPGDHCPLRRHRGNVLGLPQTADDRPASLPPCRLGRPAGTDLYAITDANDWHYHYPPLLAILLTPLADPPPGTDGAGTLSFAVSVAIWYVFSVLCLAWGVHAWRWHLKQPPFTQCPQVAALVALCILPVLVCVPGIGGTLARGQVNLLLLAVVCGMIAAALRSRNFQAGLWLAGAICLKVIPAFLLIYPLGAVTCAGWPGPRWD